MPGISLGSVHALSHLHLQIRKEIRNTNNTSIKPKLSVVFILGDGDKDWIPHHELIKENLRFPFVQHSEKIKWGEV